MVVKDPEFQRSTLNSAFVPTSAYYTYQPLYATSVGAINATSARWPYNTTDLATDEVVAQQMQHLKFPTPPITPPYNNSAYNSYKLAAAAALTDVTTTTSSSSNHQSRTAYVKATRTESVIMKTDQHHMDRSGMPPTPEHLDDVAVDIVGFDDATNDGAETLHHERKPLTSGTSSASSSPKRSEYICEWIDCGRDHNTLEALAAHVTKIHAVASPIDGLYHCRWHGCARMRGFSARYKMLVHARTHTKEKPHQCHLCPKSFSRAENLKIHIRSHSGEKPYICTYEGCQKAYSNSSDRFKHTRTHAMDKPYMCKVPGCQKRYTDPSSLRKHVKTFKHATQMLATAAVIPCKNAQNIGGGSDTKKATPGAQQALSRLQLHQQTSTLAAPTQLTPYGNHQHLHDDAYAPKMYSAATMPAVCHLCIPAAPPSHYYLSAAMEEDLCSSIKAAQLDYYYATTLGHSSKPTTSSSCSSNVQSVANTRLSMELDTPLDLRVNRS